MNKKILKPSFIRLLSVVCVVFSLIWTQVPYSAGAAPCSCWSSGTTRSWGSKCFAGWADVKNAASQETLDLVGQMAEGAASTYHGAPIARGMAEFAKIFTYGIGAMESCRMLCQNAAIQKQANWSGNPWWYADPTAYSACKESFPHVADVFKAEISQP